MSLLREALTALKDALRTEEGWKETFSGEAGYGFPTKLAGICGNVSAYLEREGIKAWDDRSHEVHTQIHNLCIKFLRNEYPSLCTEAYPVGGWREYDNEVRSLTIWKNQRRLALLDFMLEHCQ